MGSVDPRARDHAERLRRFVEEAMRPEKPYSAMIADYLEANPLRILPAQGVKGTGEVDAMSGSA